jgi:hypothetical protein
VISLIAAIAQVLTALLLFYVFWEVKDVVRLLKTVESRICDIHTVIVDDRTIQQGLLGGLRGLSGHIINAIQSQEVQTALSETIQGAFMEMERTEAASKAFRNRSNDPFIKPKE